MISAAFRPILLCLPLVAACATPQNDGYPRLLPLDQLIAPPDLPAHAADAVADPSSVESELRARAAAAQAHAAAAPAVEDAAALQHRAAALRGRAEKLRDQETTSADAPDCAAAATDIDCDPQ